MQKEIYLVFLTHFAYGMLFNLYGPIVPYLSESIGVTQSQFTYIFIIRGICYLLAGFANQKILNHYCVYKRMLLNCLICGISLILFQFIYDNFFLSALTTFCFNFTNGSIEILITILLVSVVKGDPKKAIGLSYGFYGVGAVMGSVIVSILGVNALIFCGILIFIIGVMYFDLASFRKQKTQGINQQMISNEIKNEKQQQKKVTLSQIQEKYFCYLFLLYAAISLAFRVWFPSFIVMEDLASKETAAISISIYSAALTIFRFTFTYWNPEIIRFLNNTSTALIGTLVISIIFYYSSFSTVLVFGSSLVLGVLFASYTPFLYALPSHYQMTFSQQGVSNTIIYYAIGEAVISAFIGCLMDWIHPIMLFFSLLIFSVLNKIVLERTIICLQNGRNKRMNPEQIQMKEVD